MMVSQTYECVGYNLELRRWLDAWKREDMMRKGRVKMEEVEEDEEVEALRRRRRVQTEDAEEELEE